MQRSLGLNVWVFLAIAAVILGNLYLLYILGNKLLQALNHEEAASKRAVLSTSTMAALRKHAQLTSETTRSSTGHPSIKIFTRQPTITAVVSEELAQELTTPTYGSTRAVNPNSYEYSSPRKHKEHRNRHSHSHRQQRPRKNKNTQPRPKQEVLKVAELRHDQHSLVLESSEKIISQTNSVLPNIKVTSTELRKLYATQEKAAAKNAVAPHSVLDVIEHRKEHLVTLVTALLDIGRETWPHYGRSFAKYHVFMQNVLQIRLPLVVFVDQRSVEFVRNERHKIGWLEFTKIWVVTIEDLPLYLYHRTMKRIMEHEINGTGWRPEWDSAMKSHPETCNFKYDVLVNSKPYFLYNASNDNPFDTKFFTWLDAGYGHGKMEYFPYGYEWKPMFAEGKVSIIKLTPYSDKLTRYSLQDLYRQDVAVVSGGFLAGDRPTLAKFYQHYHWKVVLLLTDHHVIDDDQTVLVLLIKDQPDLFNVVLGDWFDAFLLF